MRFSIYGLPQEHELHAALHVLPGPLILDVESTGHSTPFRSPIQIFYTVNFANAGEKILDLGTQLDSTIPDASIRIFGK